MWTRSPAVTRPDTQDPPCSRDFRPASLSPPTRQESRWHGFRSGLNVASQPSLASLPSTSLLRNKYLYLAPAFPQGLEAPAANIHTESPIPLCHLNPKLEPTPSAPELGPEMPYGAGQQLGLQCSDYCYRAEQVGGRGPGDRRDKPLLQESVSGYWDLAPQVTDGRRSHHFHSGKPPRVSG